MYILDTSTVSYFCLGKSNVVDRVLDLPQHDVFITPITLGEGYFGLLCASSKVSEARKSEMRDSLALFPVLDLTGPVGLCYAELKVDAVRRSVWSKGMDNDIWIAAFCEHHRATLITADLDFQRLEKLSIDVEYL